MIFAAALFGMVIGISDGDTLTVLVDQKPVKVRIAEIDAPEKSQAFGRRSKQSLADLCHRKEAKVTQVDTDRYKRPVAVVTCGGYDVATHQVSTGMAWVYDSYSTPSSPLYALQTQAREAGIGLWSDANPTPPWGWRRKR